MKFTRVTGTSLFEQDGASQSLSKIFLYCDLSSNQVEFDNNFIAGPTQWVICIIKVDDGKPSDVSTARLDSLFIGTPLTGMVIWMDNFKCLDDQHYFGRLKRIKFTGNKITTQLFTPIAPGFNSLYDMKIGGLDNVRASIKNNNLTFSSVARAFFKINKSQASLKDIYLDLNPASIDKGSLKIQSEFEVTTQSFINPRIGYISRERLDHPATESLIASDLFDGDDLGGAYLEGTYYPFEDICHDNAKDINGYHSVFEIKKDLLRTNFLDTRGIPYLVDSSSEVKFCFSRVVDLRLDRAVSRENNPAWDKILLRPLGKLRLKSDGRATHLLVGASGTESFTPVGEKLEIEFKDDELIKVDHTSIALVPYSKKTRTSLAIVRNKGYNVDSEGAASFTNSAATDPAASSSAGLHQVPYAPLKFRTGFETPIPIIPTRSFRKNTSNNNPAETAETIERGKLEEIFKKIRLANARKLPVPVQPSDLATSEEYITPQGFIKKTTEKKFEFINPTNSGKFSFTGVDDNLELGLRKDQVFFVLTPALMKRYRELGGNVQLDAFFAVNIAQQAQITFGLDLRASFPGNFDDNNQTVYTNDQSIVIFKFNRKTVRELIEDTSKWTNHDAFDIDLIGVKQGIKNSIGFTDDYFNKILDDPNWNGVVILNIPLLGGDVPPIFKGIASSQKFAGNEGEDLVKFKTALKFQYVAFPINKTKILNGKIEIDSSSFFGLIDYAPFRDPEDYRLATKHFTDNQESSGKIKDFRFLLSKLKVVFANSSVKSFTSYAFIQFPELFDDSVTITSSPALKLANPTSDEPPVAIVVSVPNLIRLDGSYQKNSAGQEQIDFSVNGNVTATFDQSSIIKSLRIKKIGFGLSDIGNANDFRFDFDADVTFTDTASIASQLFSFDSLKLQNIGFNFTRGGGIPIPKFDLSHLLVIPDISFNGNGFLRSFPISFRGFKSFSFKNNGGKFDFIDGDFDYIEFPQITMPALPEGIRFNLFSFIFDFDLGTLGNLGGLKALKGQLVIGWCKGGGFTLGLKLTGGGSDGLHINLFGALKLDVEKLDFCQVGKTFIIRLLDTSLTIFGLRIPKDKNEAIINGVIFAKPGSNIAWLVSYEEVIDQGPPKKTLLKLGVGQRVGPAGIEKFLTVADAISETKKVFDQDIEICGQQSLPSVYNPDRNWLIASESVLPKDTPVDLSFIFNDPVLYGIHLGFKGDFLKGLSVDILYKKLSEDLGVYTMELQLPDAIRSRDVGGAYFRLPNLGIEIYTNGDWTVDLGFPRANDWSRSGFLQLRTVPPFVGWFGFYLKKSSIASLTLFKGYISDKYSSRFLTIIQAGFALRVGVGTYLDGGVFYVGASISVYGILEGSFAFEKGEQGLAQAFPDHIAVFGRVGAIAELVGYVNFAIIQASIYISLRAEFGMLFVILNKRGSEYRLINPQSGDVEVNREYFGLNRNQSSGLQPVKVYVEGEVIVRVCVKIGCVKIRLSFRAFIRFEFTIGGGGGGQSPSMLSSSSLLREAQDTGDITVRMSIDDIREIPMIYLPAFSKVNENDANRLKIIHTFMIPFFATRRDKTDPENPTVFFPKDNILTSKILVPFFKKLLEVIHDPTNQIDKPESYETLRRILLTGNCSDTHGNVVNIKIEVPNYVPTFIHGINTDDESEIRQIVDTYFGFAGEALLPCKNGCEIVNRYGDQDVNESLLYMIPAPIVSKIKVVDKDGTDVFNTTDHFHISIEGLVDGTINDKIKAIPKPQTELDNIQKFYDDYKTQFIDRKKRPNNLEGSDVFDPDLRDKTIVPEFFQLLALVALESFHSGKTRTSKENNEVKITPAIGDGVFRFEFNGTAAEWIPDGGELQDIVGQINYFYNSGLRLPLSASDPKSTTQSIFDMLGQSSNVTPRTDEIFTRDTSNLHIKFTKESGEDIEVTSDIFTGEGAMHDMWTFIDHFNRGFDLANLQREFYHVNDNGIETPGNIIMPVKPFSVVDVTLALMNGRLEVTDSQPKVRFFGLPERLLAEGTLDSRYQYEINFKAASESGADSQVILTTLVDDNHKGAGQFNTIEKCLNVEMRVKRHLDANGRCRALEIVNVNATDVAMTTALNRISSQLSFGTVDAYFKPEKDANANQDKIDSVILLGSGNFSLMKVNLSPRTAPPQMDLAAAGTIDGQEQYIVKSSDTNAFFAMLREALSTNSGGYFIVFDSPIVNAKDLVESKKQESITLSFPATASDHATGVPAFFNSLKVKDTENVVGTDSMFKLLDPAENEGDRTTKKKYYLYLDRIFSIRGAAPAEQKKKVGEFHTNMPVHNIGFKLLRDLRKNPDVDNRSNYLNYLPLEFSITNTTDNIAVLDKEKVLPIMPTSQFEMVDGVKKIKDDNLLEYNHVTPLLSKKKEDGKEDKHNLNRYDAVGKDFEIAVGLRDAFGFRSKSQPMETIRFTHLYSDKIVGMETWPLCGFTYWCNEYNDPVISFGLISKMDMMSIQDIAGISQEHKARKYNYGDKVISKADVDKINAVLNGVLTNLFTIQSQLMDSRVKIFTQDQLSANDTYKSALLVSISALTKALIDAAKGNSYDFPATDPVPLIPVQNYTYRLDAEELKKEIIVDVKFKRDATLKPDVTALQTEYEIWDYQNTYELVTKIKAQDPTSVKPSTVADLNDAVRNKTKLGDRVDWKNNAVIRAKYSLGASSNQKGKKFVYLINEEGLAKLKAGDVNDGKFLQEKCYYGIKPFSNKLWSGTYEGLAPRTSLSNIDLDLALRTVLKKVSDLLNASTISTEMQTPLDRDYYQKLIACKRQLAIKLQSGPASFASKATTTSDFIKIQFKELLLRDLDNFYNYDGLIKTSLTGFPIPAGHMLSISLFNDIKGTDTNSSTEYEFTSSKLESGSNDWTILFDHTGDSSNDITFNVRPIITHIEMVIGSSPGSDVDESLWIQLLSPILPDNPAGGKKPAEYIVDKWKGILRRFPDKPTIISHEASQIMEEKADPIPWNANVGLWKYIVKINMGPANKPLYDTNDRIGITLLKEAPKVRDREASDAVGKLELEALVGYWSSVIVPPPSVDGATRTANAFPWKNFVDDLYNCLVGPTAAGGLENVNLISIGNFELKKSNNQWIADTISRELSAKKIQAFVEAVEDRSVLRIEVSSFDIFSPEEIARSLKSSVRVFRNKEIPNEDFHYETEEIFAAEMATPSIRFGNPMPLNVNKTFATEVFGKIKMPFKATAKFLINLDDAFPSKGHLVLPSVPVHLQESSNGVPYATDSIFDKFSVSTGYHAFSLIVYNLEDKFESRLPLFHADTIVKCKYSDGNQSSASTLTESSVEIKPKKRKPVTKKSVKK